jgi:transposase
MGDTLSPQLRVAFAPFLSALEAITARIREYDAQIEKLAEESYPDVALLKQVKGVGTLIALTYILTLEDPRRFRKSRDAGCYVGLQPGRRNSGQSEPQLHITREGDSYLRMVLVQGAQHILGPFGEDSDLIPGCEQYLFRDALQRQSVPAGDQGIALDARMLWKLVAKSLSTWNPPAE